MLPVLSVLPVLFAPSDVEVVPLHLGALHPVEQLLTVLVAFGPFVVLAVVLYARRGREEPGEDGADAERGDPVPPGDTGPPR